MTSIASTGTEGYSSCICSGASGKLKIISLTMANNKIERVEELTGASLMLKYIVVDPKICHGKPVFRGTRVLVADVLEMLAAGMTIKEILEEYPQLTEEMIREALRLAAQILRREWHVIEIPTR